MPRISAGLLVYRRRDGALEVLLAHPGGPLFRHKDDGHWSIPKGEPQPGEELLDAARREFREEIGQSPGGSAPIPLQPITQKGGKIVYAWAVEGDWTGSSPQSNLFTMEWPPGSGRMAQFPEIDEARFFPLDAARRKIKPAQIPLLDELEQFLRRQALAE